MTTMTATKAAAKKAATAPRASSRRSPDEFSDGRVTRLASREWVRLGDVKVNPEAQREYVPARAAKIAANFNPELFGLPKVNMRGGVPWVVDGQHRIGGLKIWLGPGWEDQHFEAEMYHDLTEAEEANLFLGVNDAMAVNAFNRFRVGVVAGRPDETAVARIVEEQALTISQDSSQTETAVRATATLIRIYQNNGPEVLARTLAILRDAYGVPGLGSLTLGGLALVLHRFGDQIDDNDMVARLKASYGGVGGLLNKAELARKETGNPKTYCVAAAIVDTYNGQAKRGQAKVTSWWKVDR